jgi:hypothetical protein
MTTSKITKIEFESVAVEPEDTHHNHSWVLNSGGEFYHRKNSRDAFRGPVSDIYWFDSDYPAAPTSVVPSTRMAEISRMIESLLKNGDTTLPDDGGTEHGGWDRLTITTKSRVVVVESHSSHGEYMSDLVNPLLSLIYGN